MKDKERTDGDKLHFKREDTYCKTEACVWWRKDDARDTALKAKIEVKLDPEAGLHAASERGSGPCLERCNGQC